MRGWASHITTLLRRGLPVLAVYALLLQAFLGAASPARAFDPSAALLCSELAAGADPAPIHVPDGDHVCPCLSHCAAPHAPAALTGGDAYRLPLRDAALAPPAPAPKLATPAHPLRRGPGARAPPLG